MYYECDPTPIQKFILWLLGNALAFDRLVAQSDGVSPSKQIKTDTLLIELDLSYTNFMIRDFHLYY